MKAQRKRIHLIANAHLDPVWQWPWEEGLAEALATFTIAADFCEMYEDFQFTHNESLLYAWVEQYDPSLFRRIQNLVRKGVWNISGGAFLQPDLNGPCGESHIRQLLIGLDYFRDRFGQRPRCAYNFDPFGQPEGLAQILRGCGMHYYIFCRPGYGSYELPIGAFFWKDRSGLGVLSRRSDDHYNSYDNIREKLETFTAHYREEPVSMLLWGLGNHGGGPSKSGYAAILDFFAGHEELECVHSSPEAFFEELTQAVSEFPEVRKEIQECFPGCYSSMNRLKQQHRCAEALYYTVEMLAAFRWWRGAGSYPRTLLSSALKDILFCEFHDILPGSGTPAVETDSRAALFRAEDNLRRLRMELLMPLLRDHPRAEEGEIPVFLVNPGTTEFDGVAEFEFQLAYTPLKGGKAAIEVCRDGKPLPFQRIKAEHNLRAEWRPRLAVRLRLSPWEIARLTIRCRCLKTADKGETGRRPSEAGTTASPEPAAAIFARNSSGPIVIENRSLKIRINDKSGLIDSIAVKESGKELFKAGAFLPVVLADLSHSWTCGDPAQFQLGGVVSQIPAWTGYTAAFRLARPEELPEISPISLEDWKPLRIVEAGPVFTRIEAVFVYRRSYIIRSYTVETEGDFLEIRDRVFFAEKDMMLKNSAELKCCCDYTLSETLYSAARRDPDSEWKEHHNQRWTALCGSSGNAVLVINDASFAHSFVGRTYAATILRSPTYTSFGISADDPWQAGRYLPRQGQGLHESGFRIYYQPRFSESEAAAAADNMNRRPFSLPFFPGGHKQAAAAAGRSGQAESAVPAADHEPPTGSEKPAPYAAETAGIADPTAWITTGRPEIRIEAVKKAEREESLIVRLRNTAAERVDAALKISGLRKTAALRFEAYRIKTLAVSRNDGSVREVNLVEEDE
jgi:alpha-mannosidase